MAEKVICIKELKDYELGEVFDKTGHGDVHLESEEYERENDDGMVTANQFDHNFTYLYELNIVPLLHTRLDFQQKMFKRIQDTKNVTYEFKFTISIERMIQKKILLPLYLLQDEDIDEKTMTTIHRELDKLSKFSRLGDNQNLEAEIKRISNYIEQVRLYCETMKEKV